MSDFDYASAETTDFTSIPIIDMPDPDAETGLNSPEFVIFAQALMSAATEVGFFICAIMAFRKICVNRRWRLHAGFLRCQKISNKR